MGIGLYASTESSLLEWLEEGLHREDLHLTMDNLYQMHLLDIVDDFIHT